MSAGAGIDSFFETLLKSHILLGDMDLLEWFDAAYDAVQRHTVKKVSDSLPRVPLVCSNC